MNIYCVTKRDFGDIDNGRTPRQEQLETGFFPESKELTSKMKGCVEAPGDSDDT